MNKLALLTLTSLSLVFSPLANAHCGDKSQHKKRQRPAFSTLDLNGDGNLTLSEFEQHELPRSKHEKVFGRIDADGDGNITELEFTSHKPRRHKGKKMREQGQENTKED